MLEKIENLLFPTLLFSIVLQTGKHFWPNFSFVSGIRVDYLSPTLYISDILIFFLFILVALDTSRRNELILFFQKKSVLFFLLLLFVSSLFSKSHQASFLGILKFLEVAFFAHFVSKKFQGWNDKSSTNKLTTIASEGATGSLAINFQSYKQKNMVLDKSVFFAFLSGTLITSLLLIWQFLGQESVGGIFYFLGERTFNASTINIAQIHYGTTLLLRPYATFPHPNVAAFYVLVSLVLLWNEFLDKGKKSNLFLFFVLLFASVALFLTFSRIIIFAYIFFLIVVFLSTQAYRKKTFFFITLATLFIIFFSVRFFETKFLHEDWNYRAQLTSVAAKIFFKEPLLGVGIHNFYIHEIDYQKTLSPTLLQPVHNIYFLTLAETGIVGFCLFIYFLVKTFRNLFLNVRKAQDIKEKKWYQTILLLFCITLFVGFFDHFLLTVQQGQLMFALLLGLCWVNRIE